MYIINKWSALLTVVGSLSFHTTDAQIRPGGKMTPKFINTILKLHNDYRRSEGASNMKQLASIRWSRKLQNDAQAWAGKCRYAHAYGKWGENVFKAESFLPDDVLIERAVNEWYFEKMSWKFTPDCSEACHYTQVVWAESEEIGCAFKRCTTLFLTEEFIPNGWMLVCYYNPQGNIIGQMPYTHGKPCSTCKQGYTCSRKLCGKGAVVGRYMPHNNPRPKPTPRVNRAPPHPTQLRQHTSHSARPQANRHKSGPNAPPPPAYRYQPAANQPPRTAAYQPPRPAAHPPRQPAHPPRQQLHPARQPAPHNTRAPVRQYQAQPMQQSYPSQKRANPPPPQPQATAQVQYISGKVLTGWMPVKTPPRSQPISHNNQTSFPSLSTPVLSGNTIIKSVKPIPTKPRQEQNPYSGGRSAPSSQSNGVQYPQPSPVQHQQQYSVQQPIQQQPQIQHQPKPSPHQLTHFKYQQPQLRPSVPVNTQQFPAHQAPKQYEQQQQPQQQVAQPAPQPYRLPQQSQHVPVQQPHQIVQSAPQPYRQPQQSQHVPVPQPQQAVQSAPQPFRQTQQYPQGVQQQYRPQPNTNQRPTAYAPQQYQNPYSVNTSNQIPNDQRGSVQPQHGYQAQGQPYHQYQGQRSPQAPAPAYPQYQEQRRPQPAHVFVDPRPIYVPPAPAPPPTTTTPPPPPPTCYDQDKNCKHWGVYCTSNPYVHDNCRMTCSTCTIPKPPIVPEKVLHTTATPTTTPRPSIVPSNPPSPITARTYHHRNPMRHPPRKTPPPPMHNNYPTTTAAYYPQTTGFNQQQAPTHVPAQGAHGVPGFGLCTDFDQRCKQWAKYCGIDEYVDDMCRLTCMRCR
ncbi:PI16 [Mytilus coruscus]|uniref:PI16 n=1 Tax=Mytilus coruscus TaxID=42192 RepID=A0A6J8E020_MYTCO|nr:PI16 [Mytilus coruscus]